MAAIGVIVTWQQKNRADRRSEWWRRSAWAFERSFSENESQRRLGWQLPDVLFESRLATSDDSGIVQVIGERVAAEKGR
ncbi:hypothetical protein NM962_20400 [Mycobacterium sp. SVM_VP21]|nr:hypothetical protein NM962_20400 [Mycobacterium sp. SVM_VP21]